MLRAQEYNGDFAARIAARHWTLLTTNTFLASFAIEMPALAPVLDATNDQEEKESNEVFSDLCCDDVVDEGAPAGPAGFRSAPDVSPTRVVVSLPCSDERT